MPCGHKARETSPSGFPTLDGAGEKGAFALVRAARNSSISAETERI